MTTRVLIADDDADFRLTLKSALELAGYAVDITANGEQALAIQRVTPADILITDIFMPDRDDLEPIDVFRREFPRTKIIAMSGGSQLAKRGDYLTSAALIGIEATLQKPFKIELLLSRLRSLQG